MLLDLFTKSDGRRNNLDEIDGLATVAAVAIVEKANASTSNEEWEDKKKTTRKGIMIEFFIVVCSCQKDKTEFNNDAFLMLDGDDNYEDLSKGGIGLSCLPAV